MHREVKGLLSQPAVPSLLLEGGFGANVQAALRQVMAVDSKSVRFVLDRLTGKAKLVEATEKNPRAAMEVGADGLDSVFGYVAKADGEVSLLFIHAPQTRELGADASQGTDLVHRFLEAFADAGLPPDTLTLVTRESYGNLPSSTSSSTVFMNPLRMYVNGQGYIPRQ